MKNWHTDMNIRFLMASLFTALLATGTASAGDPPFYSTTARDTHIRLDSTGRTVKVNFTLDLGERIVGKQHKRIVTPAITATDGSREVLLAPVVATGRNRAIKERTEGNAGAEAGNAYRTFTGNDDACRLTDYEAEVAYEPWMDNAAFCLRESVTGCACDGILSAEQVVKTPILYRPQIRLSALRPCPKDFTPRHEERDAFLIYPVNQTRLYPDSYGNRAELQKIDSALTYVSRNPAYRISRIYISGYASPEGSWEHNVELAEGRAEALKAYVKQRYNLPDSLLEVTPGAENWEGLRDVLRHYELPYKDEVLAAIDSIAEPDERDQALKRIGGGLPYRTLLSAVYPSLRKNNFNIAYISRERTVKEADKLAFAQPEELNVYEFYSVADSLYAGDRDTYSRLLLIAADTYPRHTVANAATYLDRAGNDPATLNNRGCLYWQQGRRTEAADWWKKAAALGNEEARHNLNELKRLTMDDE